MNGSQRIIMALLLPLLAACSSMDQAKTAEVRPDVPYRLTLKAFTIEGLPGLHSVAHTVYDNKLVIVSGRKNGMHDFLARREAGTVWSFPPATANDHVYVVDMGTPPKRPKLIGSASVASLPLRIALQLRATNTQSFTKDGWFYIVGGYGATADGNSMTTYDQVVAIDLAALIETVKNGGKLDAQFARQHMRAGDHPALAVSGGGIAQITGDKILLVFGQLFKGLYTTDGSVAQQEYSQAVRMLSLSFSTETGQDQIPGIKVKYEGKCPDPPQDQPQPTPDGPYHRRDFTLASVPGPGGESRFGVFGGVFKGGRMEGYVHPVYITTYGSVNCITGRMESGFQVEEDTGSSQWLSQYEGAMIPVFDQMNAAVYTTSFGGISQYYSDAKTGILKHDAIDFSKDPPVDGLPFINSVSTLRVGLPTNGEFLHLDQQFPPIGGEPLCVVGTGAVATAPYLGTNSWFVMDNRMPSYDDALRLNQIVIPTVVGYIFGGIASTLPYPGKATCASNLVYEVTLDPNKATRTVELQPPTP
jgi:hypothetical protein